MLALNIDRMRINKLKPLYEKYTEAHKELIDMLFAELYEMDWECLDVTVGREDDMIIIHIKDYSDFSVYLQGFNIVLDWHEDREYFDSIVELFLGISHLIRGAKLEKQLEEEADEIYEEINNK